MTEVTMRKAILALVVAASAITGAATSASAQGVYFSFGDRGYRQNYDNGYRQNYRDDGYRPYYRQQYRHGPYAYGERCTVRVKRHFNRYRGVWVVKRIRTCR